MASNDSDNNDAAFGKILDFLETIISPDDLEIVQALFCGADDVDEAREAQAVARRDDDRRTTGRRPIVVGPPHMALMIGRSGRPMSDATEAFI